MGKTQRTERLARGEVNFGCRADDEFDAAASDVDAERRAAVEIDRRPDRAVNVVRFLFAGDHSDANPRFVADPANELPSIRRFAHGARGDGHDLVDFPPSRHGRHFLQRGDRPIDRLVVERSTIEAAQPELDHLFLLVSGAVHAG